MVRRGLEDAEVDRESKRRRRDDADRLSKLSDELLLRALSFLPVPTLTICQRCVQASQMQSVF